MTPEDALREAERLRWRILGRATIPGGKVVVSPIEYSILQSTDEEIAEWLEAQRAFDADELAKWFQLRSSPIPVQPDIVLVAAAYRRHVAAANAVRAEDPRLEAFMVQGQRLDQARATLAKIDRRPQDLVGR